MEYKNLNSLSKLLACHQPMIVHLLLSISIFCLVFSHSSLFSSLVMYSKNLNYFSTSYTFHLLISGAANKNCIFLICNGLLFFVAKTSAAVPNNSPPPSSFDLNDDVLQKATESSQPLLEIKDVIVMDEMIKDVASMEESGGDHESVTEEDHEEETRENDGEEDFDEGTKEVSIFIAESADEEGGDRSGQEERENGESDHESKFKDCWLFDDEEEDEELYGKEEDEVEEEEEYVYDDGTEKLSTEELNKKFEDFIRKTKEEIRINDARQHALVMVN